MQIRWDNVVILILLIALVIVLGKFGPSLVATLKSIGEIGPGHSNDEKTAGLLALGLVCVFVVAVVRLLSQRR